MIETVLKWFALVYAVCIIFVLVYDLVDLVLMLKRGVHVRTSVYITGTLRFIPFAPIVVLLIVANAIAAWDEWLEDKFNKYRNM